VFVFTIHIIFLSYVIILLISLPTPRLLGDRHVFTMVRRPTRLMMMIMIVIIKIMIITVLYFGML